MSNAQLQLAHLELTLLRDRITSIRGELAELPIKRSGIEQQNSLLGGLDYSLKQVDDACALLPPLEIERIEHSREVWHRPTSACTCAKCNPEDIFIRLC